MCAATCGLNRDNPCMIELPPQHIQWEIAECFKVGMDIIRFVFYKDYQFIERKYGGWIGKG